MKLRGFGRDDVLFVTKNFCSTKNTEYQKAMSANGAFHTSMG
jgi:hypothetical protein